MKSFPALILLLGFTWTQFYNSAVLGIYELNKTDFIEQFCENKEEPELKCNGKCHLSKQLVETSQESSQNEAPRLIPEQELFHCEIDFSIKTPEESNTQKQSGFIKAYSTFIQEIDHPPRI